MKAPGDQPDRAGDGDPSQTSPTLLDRLKGSDPEGWRRLVRVYGPLVYQWCRRWRLQAEDAADVSQEVFRTVAARIGDFRRQRPGDSFRGWLWTITRHKLGDHFRRQQREPLAAGGSGANLHLQELPDQLPDDDQSTSESSGVVHRALALIRVEFTERTWQAFWRTAVEGHAPKDVAADLGVTPDAIRVAKSRVLRRLREELPDVDGQPDA